jgi:hypothetical protein
MTEHVVPTEVMSNPYRVLVGLCEGKSHLGDLDRDGMIILK